MSEDKDHIAMLVEQTKALLAQNAQLAERVASLEAALPAAEPEVLAPGQFREFPAVVYRLHGEDRPKQIDHPLHDAMIVASQGELEAALADGWTRTPEAPKAKTGKGK